MLCVYAKPNCISAEPQGVSKILSIATALIETLQVVPIGYRTRERAVHSSASATTSLRHRVVQGEYDHTTLRPR